MIYMYSYKDFVKRYVRAIEFIIFGRLIVYIAQCTVSTKTSPEAGETRKDSLLAMFLFEQRAMVRYIKVGNTCWRQKLHWRRWHTSKHSQQGHG